MAYEESRHHIFTFINVFHFPAESHNLWFIGGDQFYADG